MMVVLKLINNLGVHNVFSPNNLLTQFIRYGKTRIIQHKSLVHQRLFSASSIRLSTSKSNENDRLSSSKSSISQRRIKDKVPKISLYYPNNVMIVADVDRAQKIAKRFKYNLVKEGYDKNLNREVYRLLTPAGLQQLGDELNTKTFASSEKRHKKGQKLMQISSKIADHDFCTKLSKICALLQDGYDVRIHISTNKNISEQLKTLEKKVQVDGQATVTEKPNGTVTVEILTNHTK